MLSIEQKQIRRKWLMEFVADKPGVVFLILYAIMYLTTNVATDVTAVFLPVDNSASHRYLFPIAIAFPFWLGLKSNSKRFILQQQQTNAGVCQDFPRS